MWLTLAVLLLCSSATLAQYTWRRAYGAFANEDCKAVRWKSDNEFLSVGSTGSFGNGSSDIYLFAVDGSGIRLWSRTIGGPTIEYATDMQVADDGTLYVVGSTNEGEGDYNGLILHLEASGAVIWQRTYGGSDWDFFHSIRITAGGDLLVAGQTFTGMESAAEGWLLRLDGDGNELWSVTEGGLGEQGAYAAIPTSDGGVAMCGYSAMNDQEPDAWVVKYDASGEQEWNVLAGGDSLDIARDILETIDGGYSIIGTTRSFASFNEAYHVKWDAYGVMEWERNWGQISDQEAYEHIQLLNGEFLFVGYTTTSGGGGKDIILQKNAQNGDFIFGRTYGGGDDDSGYSLTTTSTGFLCGGITDSYGAGGYDVFLVRSDAIGATETETVLTNFDPIAVQEFAGPVAFTSIYPNPSAGAFTIKSDKSITHVRVLDGLGRVAAEARPATGEKEFRFDLRSGTYTVVWTDRSGAMARSPLIIQGP